MNICVVGPNPFGSELESLVAGESVNARRLEVRQVQAADAVEECQLLFVPASARERKRVLERASRLPILTIGESPDFLDNDGIVNLHLVAGKIRFDINLIVAQRNGLQISSQLLRLALTVRGEVS